jgi:lipoprotein NlpI
MTHGLTRARFLKTCLLFVLLPAIPCHAQSNDDLKQCRENSQTNPDMALQHCSNAIQSGSLSPRDLAVAFNYRGNAYYWKGDYDHAIRDYDQAIRLNPNYANAMDGLGLAYKFKGDFDHSIQIYDQAVRLSPTSTWVFSGRGATYFAKGDYDRAIEDFSQAIRLDPRNSQAFCGRGLAQFCLGNFALAQPDFTEALRQETNNIFFAVWLFLTESKGPNNLKLDQADLKKSVPHPETGQWPGFIAAFFLDMVPPDKVVSVAKSPYPGDPKIRLCEAYFYAGEHSLIGGNKVEAADYFQKSLDTGGTGAAEYQMAKEELRRLKSLPNH